MSAIHFIGLGLSKRFLTNAALQTLRNCDVIYFDFYTSLSCDLSPESLAEITGKKVVSATRDLLERREREILLHLENGKDVCIATVGDPMIATTHVSLFTEAVRRGHEAKVIPGLSVHCYAISRSMLSSYKFGKSVTITFPVSGKLDFTPYNVIKQNRDRGLHTIVYLDLKEDMVMTAQLAISYLLKMEDELKERVISEDDLVVIGERLGCQDERMRALRMSEALATDFGKPPHIIIIPARNLYDMEVEALKCLS
ncbi:MAG: diphthine synthase [Metallosphaera yellowstonensis]|jgi:diphthine synthase|uniref:Diphthine synthase n=1 Tax=Metallosphaera yellowstonensis MK1 TaxID=671065 RepID=H2C8H4_9CREN|nr:diphthine synthase [Metallosphaera yellowstonensis]EHP68450.1 diphthine synthase [Metallosphaera yellowstonensis MK1]